MFTDPLEELCLRKHIPLRQAMKMAIYNSGQRFSNIDEIAEQHLATYKRSYGFLPDYIKKWVEHKVLEAREEAVEPIQS